MPTDMENRARELHDKYQPGCRIPSCQEVWDIVAALEQAYRDGEMADHVRFAERTVKQVFEETRERAARVVKAHKKYGQSTDQSDFERGWVECADEIEKDIRGLE